MTRLAIDFGTTNSVIAAWDNAADAPQILNLPNLSAHQTPPIIPSLVYIGQNGLTVGQAVHDKGLDHKQDNRLFRNFKRGLVTDARLAPRWINGREWGDQDVASIFIRAMLDALPRHEIEQLVLTAPVAAFQSYITWLNTVFDDMDDIRIVDESTAAALGYAVTEPGALVLVFDFGGGTLDLSLVRLPESKSQTGGRLGRLLRGGADQRQAQVISKTGRTLGGSDVDQWLLTDILRRLNLSADDLGHDYADLLTRCEAAKIALSEADSTDLQVGSHTLTITRAELDTVLRENGFFTALRRVIDKVMITARQQGIFREDIQHVLMVGGMSLMPAVQKTLRDYFTDHAVRAEKPFTAVAEGALQVARGYGVQDYLAHGYGIRHLNTATQTHAYDEIIPMGTLYPMTKSVEVYLGAAHADQCEVEFVVGEIDTDAVAMIEVQYLDGQAVFVAQADQSAAGISPLNADHPVLALLEPSANPGDERLKAAFTVDERRCLCVTVTDLQTHKTIMRDQMVATLR